MSSFDDHHHHHLQPRLRLPQCLHGLGNVGYQACDKLLKFISVFDQREKHTCTCKRENSALLESRNDVNKDVTADGTYRDINVVSVNVNGDECRDHENNVVTSEEGALVRELERVELQNDGSDSSKIEEKKREHGEFDDKGINQIYPSMHYVPDCSSYMKNGTCKFGQNCRSNHPPRSAFQNFQTPGGSKYEDTCRDNHSAPRIGRECLELNFLGLPIRPLAKECLYYLKKGSCGYGTDCKFHHPNPSPIKELDSGNSLANGKSVRDDNNLHRNYGNVPLQSIGGVSQGTSESSNSPSYSPEMSSCHQTMPQTPGWNQSQVNSSFPANKYPLPHQVMNALKRGDRSTISTHYENQNQTEVSPERPGQRDCTYFIKTGNCKYKSHCKYNHPTSQVPKLPRPPLSSKGVHCRSATMIPAQTSQLLNSSSNTRNNETSFRHQNLEVQNGEFPARSGQPECGHHVKIGQCKFKSTSPHDHPRSRGPTSSRCSFNEKGLPLRPGVKLCRNYEQQGMCSYGSNCSFNHPSDYSPDVPVSAKLEPSVDKNVNSEWGDGWEM